MLGVHSATDASHTWPEYGAVLGARFDGHPWTQDFAIDVVDRDHPATAHLGARVGVARRGLPLPRPASRRPGAAAPGRRTRSTCPRPGGRVPDCGFPLAWCIEDGAGRTFYSALGHFPAGLGDARPICATWPEASPGWWRAHSLTPMSGSQGGRPRARSPTSWRRPSTCRRESSPSRNGRSRAPGPDQVVVRVHACGICGSDIHQLRDGWGFKPGVVAGHEWSGTHRGRRRRRDRVVGRRAGRRRRLPPLRHLPAVPGGQALPV